MVEQSADLSVVPLVEQLVDSSVALLVDLVFLLSASRSSTQDQIDHS